MMDPAKMTDQELEHAIDSLKAIQSARLQMKRDEANFIFGKFMWKAFGPRFADHLEEHGYGDLAAKVRTSLESEVFA